MPRVRGPILDVLRDITFKMGGEDLTIQLERGAEIDGVHPHLGTNAAERDNPPLIRAASAEPPATTKPKVPRVIKRSGIPSPSTSFLGWGALPPTSAPLTDPSQEFEEGLVVMSPCGTPVSRAKIGGWAKTAKELAAERKEKKSMVKHGWSDSPDDPFTAFNSTATAWTKATSNEWERSWVAARMTEDKARLRKATVRRQRLQARCRTPWRSEVDSRAGYPEPEPREIKIKRHPTGSPPWYNGKPEVPLVFVIKPPKPPPAPFVTPPQYDSPIKDGLPRPEGDEEWDDEALVPGGQTAPERPTTAPPELWRREIFDGRDGPPRPELEETGMGGLLSDYAFGTMGDNGPGDSRMPSRMTNRGGTPWTEITTVGSVQRAKTPGSPLTVSASPTPAGKYRPMGSPLLQTTTPKRHHSHGLRHSCSSSRCASKKGLYGDPVSMLPVPKARIPSMSEGAKAGVKDQVLPVVNLLKGKTFQGKSQHRLYQIHGVTPKPESPRDSPRTSCLANIESFEHNLESFQLSMPVTAAE